ncbi:MAG: RidA family protein, partial [Candidatus Bathyarchaeia archaeon]
AVLENLKALLEASGSSLDDVVKVTVFLKDIRDISAMNEAFKAHFPRDPPARSTIEAKLASPEFLVEIEAIAYAGR